MSVLSVVLWHSLGGLPRQYRQIWNKNQILNCNLKLKGVSSSHYKRFSNLFINLLLPKLWLWAGHNQKKVQISPSKERMCLLPSKHLCLHNILCIHLPLHSTPLFPPHFCMLYQTLDSFSSSSQMTVVSNCGSNCFNMRGLVKQLNQSHSGHICLCHEFLIPL